MSSSKNGNKSLVSNYRPISLLYRCVGKTFERVVYKHVFNNFLDTKLLCKYQSGFVPGCSTVHQLIEIFHKICISLDKKRFFFVQFFVTYRRHSYLVWHTEKLKSYGSSEIW